MTALKLLQKIEDNWFDIKKTNTVDLYRELCKFLEENTPEKSTKQSYSRDIGPRITGGH